MLFLALLPLIVAIAALAFGVDIIISALCGLGAALVVAFAAFPGFDGAALTQAVQNALLLTATVALVLIPGQAFNLVLSKSGALQRITAFVEAVGIDPGTKTLILILGLVPAIESLTGFGVSLFVVVPIFLHFFSTATALRLSLLSLNIMPWGTLALATIVGAQLTGLSADQLGLRTAYFSAAVFPLLGVIAAQVLVPSSRSLSLRGFILGGITGAGLIIGHLLLPIDAVGIGAGLVTTIIGYLLYRRAGARLGALSCLIPYAALLLLLIVTKLIAQGLGDWLERYALRSGRLVFPWYASPGIPLIIAAAVFYGYFHKPPIRWADVLGKVARPLSGIAIFIMLSQVLVASGAMTSISAAFQGLDQSFIYPLAPALGALSGYITGSNLGGNVLMLPIQLGLAEHTSLTPWVAAVQNATAGHTLLASLPMIMLVLAIADMPAADHEQNLVRFSFKVLLAVTALCAGLFAVIA